jgi:hypothetical protein
MGCTAQKNDKIIIVSRISNSNLSSTGAWKKNNRFSIELDLIQRHKFSLKNQYLNSITNILWLKVIDYLSYKELKEVGKINRKFNKLVKNNNVLLKFFKKINSIYSRNINKNENLLSFDTFSQLQRNSTDINSFDDISNI